MSVHFICFTKTIKLLCGLAWKGQIAYHSSKKHSVSCYRTIQSFRQNLTNVIMCNILITRILTYNLWSQTDFVRDCINKQHYGLNPLSYFAPKVCNMIPLEIKNLNYIQKFKTGIRKWAPENCSCYLCWPYIQNLGFVDFICSNLPVLRGFLLSSCLILKSPVLRQTCPNFQFFVLQVTPVF